MRIAALNDRRGWGRSVLEAARRRGHDVGLIDPVDSASSIAPDTNYLFARVAQDPDRIAADKELVVAASAIDGLTIIPDVRMIRHYEDKWAQALAYRDWMPETHLVASATDAERVLDEMQFPIVSKARHGSASKNVRLVTTAAGARREIELAFGDGIPCWGGAQRGYLIWQELLKGNAYDYRVHVVGRDIAVGRRWNAKGTVFASGVGLNESPPYDEPEVVDVVNFARVFFSAHDIRFAAIDVVARPGGWAKTWRVIETSIAWPAHKPPFRSRMFLSGRRCADLFDVIVDEIETGVFDREPAYA